MATSPHLGRLSAVRPGDVIGFSSCSPTGSLIRICTLGCFTGLTHVGIVTYWPKLRHYVLAESTSEASRPCLVADEPVCGVQIQELRFRVLEYPGAVYHYPLAGPIRWNQAGALYRWLRDEELGKGYDFEGAARARHTPLAEVARDLHGEDRQSRFCSELVAAAHRKLGLLAADINAEDFSPRRLVRTERRLGILGKRRRVK